MASGNMMVLSLRKDGWQTMEQEVGPSDNPQGESDKEKVSYANPPSIRSGDAAFVLIPVGARKKRRGVKPLWKGSLTSDARWKLVG